MTIQLKNILQNLINQDNTSSWQLNLIKNWNSIIGNLHSKVKLEKISDDTIVLGVYDSCWMQELYLLSNELIKKINSKLDEPRIKNIRFKQAKRTQKKVFKQTKNYFEFKKIELSAKESAALKNINDPQLEKVLKDFLQRCHNNRQNNP